MFFMVWGFSERTCMEMKMLKIIRIFTARSGKNVRILKLFNRVILNLVPG